MVLDDLVKILTDLAGEYHIYSEEFHHFGEEALSNPESDIIQSFIESYEDLASEQDIREALLERYDIHSTNYKSYVASPVRNYGQKPILLDFGNPRSFKSAIIRMKKARTRVIRVRNF